MKLIMTNKLVDFFLQFIIYDQFRITIINQTLRGVSGFVLSALLMISILLYENMVKARTATACLLRGIKVY